MDEFPPALRPQSPEATTDGGRAKQNKLHSLALLKMGLFEVVFVGIVLLLLFGVLNYLNILPISEVFPQQLGWLPKQQVQTSKSLQDQALQNKNIPQGNAILDKQGNPVSAPANFTPATFEYDVEKAKTLLTQYIKDTIKSSLLPPALEIQQGLSIFGKKEDVMREFGSIFNSNNSSIASNFHYGENSNTSNDFEIFIQLKNNVQTTATASLANSLLASYFTNSQAVSNCQTKENISYCEDFRTSNNGKSGYGILISKPYFIIFSCFVPKESRDYAAQKSCINQ